MLNSNCSGDPYEALISKPYISERGRMIDGAVVRGREERAYNNSWNIRHRSAPNRIPGESIAEFSLIKPTPWTFYAGTLLMNLLCLA